MKIQALSDWHNEKDGDFTIPSTAADVIVLAGDIGHGMEAVEWASHEAKRLSKPVIFVPGNHEYDGHDIEALQKEMRNFCRETGVHYLDNDEVIIDGVRFLFATLWADFMVYQNRQHAVERASRRKPEFTQRRPNKKRFSVDDSTDFHVASLAWLTEKLDQPFNGNTVVVSHHASSLRCALKLPHWF